MKVLVDLTYITENGHSGVETFALRLIKQFVLYEKMNFVFLVSSEGENRIKSLVQEHCIIFEIKTPISKRFYWFNSMYNAKELNAIVKRENIDLFFIPFVRVTGLTCSSVPMVGIVHDMAPCYIAGYIKNYISSIFFIQKIRLTNMLIAISNITLKEIIDIAKIENERVSVVYNGLVQPNNQVKPFITDKPYILYVNTLEKYKNVETLIKAINLIKDSIPHKLIIKAKKTIHYEKVIVPLIDELKLKNRIELIDDIFSDDEMTALYKGADLFVSPSTMEGFGYTPIEAAINGCPVICSAIPALLESTKGLLNYYNNPYDYLELSQKILELLHKGKNEELIHISRTFIDCYSVEKQASKIIKVIERFIAE